MIIPQITEAKIFVVQIDSNATLTEAHIRIAIQDNNHKNIKVNDFIKLIDTS